jgi:hypothetical protein
MNEVAPRRWGAWLALFTLPSLFCCALPILFVSLGMGSVVATVYGEYFPFLNWFGENKGIMFIVVGVIMITSAFLLFRPNRQCPSDPDLAEQCDLAHQSNLRWFYIALTIKLVGLISAYILPMMLLD